MDIKKAKEYGEELRTKAIERARAALTVEQAEEEAYFVDSLKPCPCCGGRADMWMMHSAGAGGHRWLVSIGCTKCRLVQINGYDTAEEARDAWNRRVEA